MFEHVPYWLGRMLRGRRAGHDKLVVRRIAAGVAEIELSSPAFADGGRLPARFTADGAGGSPPLAWGVLPEGTVSLALIAEDPDAPLREPVSHAVVWGLPPETQHLAEDAITAAGHASGGVLGKNRRGKLGWLPPDPPNGHGNHDYVFTLFALDSAPQLAAGAELKDLVAAMTGHIIGAGTLVGTYSRGEGLGDEEGGQAGVAAAPA
jgi:Raf kinase inhibitor-like YbhB/YbcL family protein